MLSASTSTRSLFSTNGEGSKMQQSKSTGTFEFLPSVSFDDLHASIESASTEFKLTQFPSPNGEGSILDSQRVPDKEKTHATGGPRAGIVPPGANRPGRSGSILRRPSTSSRQPSTSSIASSWSGSVDTATATTSVSSTSRPRRQSHYPPVSSTIVAKQPRKSIGPGVVIADADTTSRSQPPRRRPSLSSERGGGTESTRTSIDGSESARQFNGSSRSIKTKSVQPPPRVTQAGTIPSLAPGVASDANRLSLAVRSPRVSGRGTTPSSGGKRASMMPTSNHASGLGARTISPTDTRRMKRLSMMPQPTHTTSIDLTMPPPPPPLSSRHHQRADSRSPSLLALKTSGTSSSAGTTPDQNKKGYVTGIASGLATVTTSSSRNFGSIQPKLSQQSLTSFNRIPPPKSNGTHSASQSTEDDEEVPPVPAIPKAYESPKEAPVDAYFTEKKKSVVGSIDTTSIHSTSTGSLSMPILPEPTKIRRRPSARKSSYVPTSHGADHNNIVPKNKKQLAPLTLPPLTLGPLNIPSMKATTGHSNKYDSTGMASPRPSRQPPKTPTTPMTASKSTFFQNRYDEAIQLPSLRSSSSIHQSYHMDGTPDVSSSDTSEKESNQLSSISPFLSSSLPKGGYEHIGLQRSKTGGDFATVTVPVFDEQTFKKPQGPREPTTQPRYLQKSPPPIPTADEPATPSSMSSLRRKLSLSWKRGGSKGGNSVSGDSIDKSEKQIPQPQQPTKQESMPPPRIPISATTNNLPNFKPRSPVSMPKNNGAFAHPRQRKSSASSLNNLVPQSGNDGWAAKKESADTITLPATRAIAGASKVVKPKSSSTTLNRVGSWTAELDKDDMTANEEMRKMGSRRKETDIAAKTLDALHKRATPKERVGPQEAIRIAMLNIYERGEIIDYSDIYFCGTQRARKVIGDLQSDAPNFGYDDERGDYSIVPGDHLSYRYEIVDVLGKGSFGQVVRCIDHKHGVLVAVKIIRNKKRFHQQALVEVNILQKLREWDPQDKHSMVNFTQSFYFRGHLCISTELLDMNLYEFIKAHSFRGFSLRIIRRFTKQILSSLILLKKRKVIHCDLKPENILLRHPLNSEIKVIDFGSSCFENEKVYTYIQSRFYRSPEVILGMTYGLPIDMWSVGCILAELFTGVPIFPGENEQEQLACIMEVFGPPEKHLIEKSTRRKLFFDSMGKPRLTVSSKGRRRRPSSKTLQQVLKCDDEAFLDFLTRCLRWDPERRLRPEDAVRHEFITGHKIVPQPRVPVRDPSPAKRTTVSLARPLPDPPGPTMKAPVSLRNTTSPQKHMSLSIPASRRTSGAMAATAASLSRRTSAGPGLTSSSSGLPRIAPRSVSGKPDLAAAGATVAMTRRP